VPNLHTNKAQTKVYATFKNHTLKRMIHSKINKKTMKTIVQILFICFVFVAKIYAQTTEITLHVLESKDKTWQGIKLQDKRHSKLSLASKLLKANKDGKIQAYSEQATKIKYDQVKINMLLPSYSEEEENTTNYFFIKDIKGAKVEKIKGIKYLSLIISADKVPTGISITIARYKITDIEKLFKYKFIWKYVLSVDSCEDCYLDDENTDKEFVANPSMPEFEYREAKNRRFGFTK
jgi:hypothetical protein